MLATFSPNGDVLLTTAQDDQLRLYGVRKFCEISANVIPGIDVCRQLSTNPDSKGGFASAPTIISHPHRYVTRNFIEFSPISHRLQCFSAPYALPSDVASHLQRHLFCWAFRRSERCRFFRLLTSRYLRHVH